MPTTAIYLRHFLLGDSGSLYYSAGTNLSASTVGMPILALPLEVRCLVMEMLQMNDLWNVYNSCIPLRECSAPYLFRKVEISFNDANPYVLNIRLLTPSAILHTLQEWARYVKWVVIYADQEPIQSDFFDLLSKFNNLQACSIAYPPSSPSLQQLLEQLATVQSLCTLKLDYMSPKTWPSIIPFPYLRTLHLSCKEHDPGSCELPSLPLLDKLVLNFCTYCDDCLKDRGPFTKIKFNRLPRLLSLSISGAQSGSIVCDGIALQLQELEISFSSGLKWTELIQNLGPHLEVIRISDCEFSREEPLSIMTYPSLRSVKIFDSVSSLLRFSTAELPVLAELHLRINPQDFDQLEAWPLVLGFLGCVPTDLSLVKAVDSYTPLDRTGRLWQVVSLPNVRLDGRSWPRSWRSAKVSNQHGGCCTAIRPTARSLSPLDRASAAVQLESG